MPQGQEPGNQGQPYCPGAWEIIQISQFQKAPPTCHTEATPTAPVYCYCPWCKPCVLLFGAPSNRVISSMQVSPCCVPPSKNLMPFSQFGTHRVAVVTCPSVISTGEEAKMQTGAETCGRTASHLQQGLQRGDEGRTRMLCRSLGFQLRSPPTDRVGVCHREPER